MKTCCNLKYYNWKKIFNGYILLFAAFPFASCEEKPYKYKEGVLAYLKNEHYILPHLMKDHIFYILDVENCSCSETHLQSLINTDLGAALTLIIVGDSEFWQKIKPGFKDINIKHDTQFSIKHYETGFGPPLVVYFRKGDLYKAWNVEDTKVVETLNYFQQFLK